MKIRILSYNVHKGIGWVGKRSTLQELRNEIDILRPDLIFLQEICGSQFEFLAEEIFPYTSYGKNSIYKSGHHGNAILSQYPITYTQNTDISVGSYEKRGLLHVITHPQHSIHPLHLICVHLGLLKKYRYKQLARLAHYVKHHIPDNQPLIIGGDFNDWLSHASAHMIEDLGLKECFLEHHGTYAKTFPAWGPFLKLDRIYIRGFNVTEANRQVHGGWKKLSDHIALNVCLTPDETFRKF